MRGASRGPRPSSTSAIPRARWPTSNISTGGATAASSRGCSFAEVVFDFCLRKGVHNNEPTSHDGNPQGSSEGGVRLRHRAARGDDEGAAVLRRQGFRRRGARLSRHGGERQDHIATGQGGLESGALRLPVGGTSAADR